MNLLYKCMPSTKAFISAHPRSLINAFVIRPFQNIISKPVPCILFYILEYKKKWASTRENLFSGLANNKDAEQLVHPRSLISAFVFREL